MQMSSITHQINYQLNAPLIVISFIASITQTNLLFTNVDKVDLISCEALLNVLNVLCKVSKSTLSSWFF